MSIRVATASPYGCPKRGRFLANFNRIWVIHISLLWFYAAYNAPTIYQPKRGDSSALRWSATALDGAFATVIMILATLAEFYTFLLPGLIHLTSPVGYFFSLSLWHLRPVLPSTSPSWRAREAVVDPLLLSSVLPNFHLYRRNLAIWNYALWSDVW